MRPSRKSIIGVLVILLVLAANAKSATKQVKKHKEGNSWGVLNVLGTVGNIVGVTMILPAVAAVEGVKTAGDLVMQGYQKAKPYVQERVNEASALVERTVKAAKKKAKQTYKFIQKKASEFNSTEIILSARTTMAASVKKVGQRFIMIKDNIGHVAQKVYQSVVYTIEIIKKLFSHAAEKVRIFWRIANIKWRKLRSILFRIWKTYFRVIFSWSSLIQLLSTVGDFVASYLPILKVINTIIYAGYYVFTILTAYPGLLLGGMIFWMFTNVVAKIRSTFSF
jgi:hypothetical protein